MNFTLTNEQAAFKDSVRRYCDKEYSFQRRQQLLRGEALDRRNWMNFAEQGWLGVLTPAALGGSGGTLIDSVILMEEIGRALVIEPLLPCAVLAALALGRGAHIHHRETLLPSLVRGEELIALAHNETGAHGRIEYVSTKATPTRSGHYSLTGDKQLVLGGSGARIFIVSARSEGDVLDRTGILWFAVPADARGVVVRDYRLLDGRGAADVSLRNVIVSDSAQIGESTTMFQSVEQAMQAAVISLCADALGAMEAALWATRDYIRNRRAYGATLSSFQALQHRTADMFAEVELSRSALHSALAAMNEPSDYGRSTLISAAKVRIAQGGSFVCRNAIQLHGGMGMAQENRVGQYFKRLIVAATLFGSTDFHLQRFSAPGAGEAH